MAKHLAKYFLAALIVVSACHPGPARAQDAPAPFHRIEIGDNRGRYRTVRSLADPNKAASQE